MISIVVVSFNTKDFLRICLNSLLQYEPESEIIVVDNASQDGSVEMVRSEFPHVKLLVSQVNLGFAGANNIGLAEATRPFIVLFNSDAELLSPSLSRCVDRLISEPKLGAVHPLLRGNDGRPQQSLHRFPTLGKVVRQAVKMNDSVNNDDIATWLAGTCLVIRRTALDQIGGKLDDGYFMYWEDADLSARFRLAGWELAIESDAEVKHFGGASGGGPDAARRPDLYAWYCFGKHRWFRRNRPWYEGLGLFFLDAFDVPRKYLRGLIHRARRKAEWAHAGATARVLALSLIARSPRRP
jgi:GT2 family glycosyltransferase